MILDNLTGLTVRIAYHGETAYGDPFVRIHFTDGTVLLVEEKSQSGSLAVTVEEAP